MNPESPSSQLDALVRAGSIRFDAEGDHGGLWQEILPGITPTEFYEQMKKASGNEQLFITLSPKDDCVEMTIHTDGDGHEKNELVFTLSHPNAELTKAALAAQGQHAAKRYLSVIVPMLSDAGYDDIEISARDVGAYAWAKYGFVPNEDGWSELKKDIAGRLSGDNLIFGEQSYTLNKAELKILRSVLSRKSLPSDIWKITDTLNRELYKDEEGRPITVGKALMFGQQWEGELSLDSLERFEAYCGSGIPKERGPA